jgi:hypothetical protein
MNNNVFITMDKSVFEKLNVPSFSYVRIDLDTRSGISIPTKLELNRTYYKFEDNKLKAFKVLAYAIDDREMSDIRLNYLIQTPNNDVEWKYNFITPKMSIYESKEQFISGGGNVVPNMGWMGLCSCINVDFSKKVFECINGVIAHPKMHDAMIEYALYSEKGWSFCIKGRGNHKVFLSYDECLKNAYNGLVCEDFAEDTIKINIEVKVVKPITSVIKIVEL